MKRYILFCLVCLIAAEAIAQPKRKAPAATEPVATAGEDKAATFCSALSRIIADAPDNFKNIIDTNHFVKHKGAWGATDFDCKVQVPGAEKTIIYSSFGRTCRIFLGTYKSASEVNTSGTPIVTGLKGCYPEYYYEAVPEKNGVFSVEIGKSYSDGYEAPLMRLSYYFDDSLAVYKLYLDVNSGKRTRFYTASTTQDNAFTKAVKAIYNDIPNKYATVKGTRHEDKGGFLGPSVWYEISPMPEGAHDCSLAEGGMSLSNGCNCRYYLGASREEALATFNKVSDYMRATLGAPYVYTTQKPDLDMTIPSGTESIVTYGIKKRKGYESMPLISLVMVKNSDNRYAVNMLFHSFGF